VNATDLSRVTADPIQVVGMSFYFDPLTAARAKELGLNVFEFYGLGRGGVLGDVDIDAVDRAFTFFHPTTLAFLWDAARVKADPVATATQYVEAAFAFADRTFGAVPETVLGDFARAAHRVLAALSPGRSALVDGYRQFAVPANPVHAAYLGAIMLRELRGGVHIDAVAQVGLTPTQACYLQDATIFTLHGYSEDDVPVVTPELEAKKVEAEVLTTLSMAECFAVLSELEREQLAAGALAMFEALRSPVAVHQ